MYTAHRILVNAFRPSCAFLPPLRFGPALLQKIAIGMVGTFITEQTLRITQLLAETTIIVLVEAVARSVKHSNNFS